MRAGGRRDGPGPFVSLLTIALLFVALMAFCDDTYAPPREGSRPTSADPIEGLDSAIEAAAGLPTSTSTTAVPERTTTTRPNRGVERSTSTTTTDTTAPLEGGWSVAGASWYGPGFYGRTTACGQLFGPSVLGVAHRSLPCGTQVEFVHAGVTVTAPVIDRGPAAWTGRTWDLSRELCARLGRCFTAPIRWRLA